MSAVVVIRFTVEDVAKAIDGLHGKAELLEDISDSSKGTGLLHHRFVAGDGELMVIDEWETAEQFRSFFEDNSKVAEIMGAVGVTGAPVVSVFESIDVAGTV